MLEILGGVTSKLNPYLCHETGDDFLHICNGTEHVLSKLSEEVHLGILENLLVRLSNYQEGLPYNFIFRLPVSLIRNSQEHSEIQKREGIWVAAFLAIFKILVHLREGLDE